MSNTEEVSVEMGFLSPETLAMLRASDADKKAKHGKFPPSFFVPALFSLFSHSVRGLGRILDVCDER